MPQYLDPNRAVSDQQAEILARTPLNPTPPSSTISLLDGVVYLAMLDPALAELGLALDEVDLAPFPHAKAIKARLDDLVLVRGAEVLASRSPSEMDELIAQFEADTGIPGDSIREILAPEKAAPEVHDCGSHDW